MKIRLREPSPLSTDIPQELNPYKEENIKRCKITRRKQLRRSKQERPKSISELKKAEKKDKTKYCGSHNYKKATTELESTKLHEGSPTRAEKLKKTVQRRAEKRSMEAVNYKGTSISA